MVIDQTLETVAHVHRNGFVHRDISPSNFLLNFPSATRIQLIDFGQAKRVGPGPFIPAVTARRKFSFARPVVGTPRFASCWSHAGVDAAYRDDMESLGFLWIYLARGRLPWQGIRDYAGLAKITRIGQIKANEPIEQLCAGLPDEFAVYMNYVRSLRPFDLPDHDGLRDLFQALANQLGVGNYDWIFDWMGQSSEADLPSSNDVSKTYFLPKNGSAASPPKPTSNFSEAIADKNAILHNVGDDDSGDHEGETNSNQSTTPVSK
jgi:serine/threonine protein kinase